MVPAAWLLLALRYCIVTASLRTTGTRFAPWGSRFDGTRARHFDTPGLRPELRLGKQFLAVPGALRVGPP
jgi:hypothetical protein